jgi:hypothetical protein
MTLRGNTLGYARNGVHVEVRNYAGAIEHFDVLRDATSPVQAALTTFGFTQPSDAASLYSLGGISDTAIFDVAMVATQIDDSLLQRALGAPGIRLMNVAQAEAIAGGETVGTIGRIGSLE